MGNYVGGKLGTTSFSDPLRGLSAGNIAGHAVSGAASSIANAATRSAIEGSSFGRNIQAAIPDVIGSTIGNIIGGAVGGGGNALGKFNEALAKVQGNPVTQDRKDAEQRAVAARITATAEAQNISIEEASEGELFNRSANPIIGEDRTIRIEANDLFLEKNLNLTQSQIKTVNTAVGKHFNLSRDPIFTNPEETFIVTANRENPSYLLGALERTGDFLIDNIDNPLVEAGLFTIGAITAPYSTALFTAISYTPGLREPLESLQQKAAETIINGAQALAQKVGDINPRTAAIAGLGALDIVGALVLGSKALPVIKSGIGIIQKKFKAFTGAVQRKLTLARFGLNIKQLSAAGKVEIPDSRGLTVIGRALDKHAQGQRASGTFPPLKGNNAQKSKTAQDILDNILTNKKSTFEIVSKNRLEVRLPNGQGALFKKDGTVVELLDPK